MEIFLSIIIQAVLLGLTIKFWHNKLACYCFLGGAFVVDSVYVMAGIFIAAISLERLDMGADDTAFGDFIFKSLFWFYAFIPATAAIIFAFLGRDKKKWGHFWFSCANFWAAFVVFIGGCFDVSATAYVMI